MRRHPNHSKRQAFRRGFWFGLLLGILQTVLFLPVWGFALQTIVIGLLLYLLVPGFPAFRAGRKTRSMSQGFDAGLAAATISAALTILLTTIIDSLWFKAHPPPRPIPGSIVIPLDPVMFILFNQVFYNLGGLLLSLVSGLIGARIGLAIGMRTFLKEMAAKRRLDTQASGQFQILPQPELHGIKRTDE